MQNISDNEEQPVNDSPEENDNGHDSKDQNNNQNNEENESPAGSNDGEEMPNEENEPSNENEEASNDENTFMYIYEWVDTFPLSRPKKNMARDFNDAVLLAEIIKNKFPKLVEIHNYPSASSTKQKLSNWNTLNNKVLKKLGIKVSKEEINEVLNSRPKAIENLLDKVYRRMNGMPQENKKSKGVTNKGSINKVNNNSNIEKRNNNAGRTGQISDEEMKLNELIMEKDNYIMKLSEKIQLLENEINQSNENKNMLESKVRYLNELIRKCEIENFNNVEGN